ncbi:MAG: IS110 family RNA-guided transposase [Thermoplasmatota archaeon]
MRVIAMDIHKHETQACVMNDDGTVEDEKRFKTRRSSVRRVLSKYPGVPVVIETLGITRPVAKWIQEQGNEVHVANTSRIPKPAVKTDKKDAKHLANLFRANILPESYLAPEEIQRLRDLARQRQFLGEESRRLKGKIKLDLQKHGHFTDKKPWDTIEGRNWLRSLEIPEVSSCLLILEGIMGQIKEFEKTIAGETTDNADAKLLMTIPGVGAYLALLIVAEVGDFRRFKHKDAVAAYAGLGIRQSQSGDTDYRGHITKTGSNLLRWALVQAARLHVMYCPESALSRRHQRLEKTKGASRARVSTARVLATIMYTMVTRNEPFKVNPS